MKRKTLMQLLIPFLVIGFLLSADVPAADAFTMKSRFHTEADVKIDGLSATLSRNGKAMRMTLDGPPKTKLVAGPMAQFISDLDRPLEGVTVIDIHVPTAIGQLRKLTTRFEVLTAAKPAPARLKEPTSPTKTAKRARRPNVILIMADDLGSECLGCYGGKDYSTPRLDRMAREGLRFTYAFCTPLCTPTRVQLMTGKYNHRNYVKFAHLDPKERTFGHMLRDAGYATCIVGKDQLGLKHQDGKHGFDTWCLGDLPHWQPRNLTVNGRKVETSPDDYGPDIYCKHLMDFIEANRNRPFFAYFPMHLTHFPFESTPDSDGPRLRMEDKSWGGRPKTFPDMVAYCDKLVGQILDGVDKLGIAESTLVIFTTDNGTDQRFVSQCGDRKVKGGKSKLTDAGTRVPLIARWTGTTPAGQTCEDLVDFTDLYPTLAELAGADLSGENDLDGRSLLPRLQGRKGNPREWVFLYHVPHGKVENRKRDGYWARNHRWKLYHDGRLYHVETDPDELSPIPSAEDMPGAALARKRLNAVFAEVGVSPESLP